MPALVFPAPGFTTSTQYTGTFSTFLITIPGRVAPRSNIRGPVDKRTFGKVAPRSNIRGTVDRRQTFGKVLPRSNIRGLPVYITPPKITTFKVASGSISSIDNNYSIVSKLSPFVNQGLTSGPRYASMLSTIINDNVNYTIYDRDILTSTRLSTTATQTLYFNPQQPLLSLTFKQGEFVNVADSSTGFSSIVEVSTSTVNSITFNAIAGLPNTSTGGLSVQSASDDLYPTSSVLANYYANLSRTGIWLIPTTPRENLAFSQMELTSLRYRSQQYYIDREIAGTLPLLNSTTNSLSTFSDARIPGDFRLTITGQTSYQIDDTVNWYLFDNDVLNNKLFGVLSDNSGKIIVTENGLSITSLDSIKTIYFAQQDAAPFPSGSTVRIINSTVGYTQDFTVINGTGNSVSFTNPTNLPVGGLTIEKIVASVYPQNFVITQVAPTNARENLYYFNISPGLRAGQQYFISSGDARLTSGNLSKQLLSLKSPTTQLSVAKLSSVAKLTADSNILKVNKLSSAAKLTTTGFTQPRLFVSTITNFYNQLEVAPAGAPTNARETFFYFNLAPGLRSNSSIVQGVLTSNSFLPPNSGQVLNPIPKLIYDTALFNPGNLKSVSVLKEDGLKFNYEQLDIFKIRSDTTQVFETPLIGNIKPFSYNFTTFNNLALNTGNIKPFSYNFTIFNDLALNTGNLKSTAKLIGADGVFNNERLNDSIFLRPVNGIFDNEQIDTFEIRSNTVQFFETPSSSKLVSVASLKSDKNIFSIDKLSATAVMRADTSRLTTDNLKSSAVLKEYGDPKQLYRPDSFDNYIDQTTVRPTTAPSNASELFYYFNLAPGYRRNISIQQGKIFEPPNSIIKNDRLELFDNIGYQLNVSRIYNVSGQTTGVTANTVLFYQDDLDILTATTTQIESVTIFFENLERSAFSPFNVGDTVYVTKNQYLEPIRGFIFIVLASTSNSITIEKPADWDTTWAFSTIRLTSAEYYPRALVKTNVAPTNAREALYYAEMVPGKRQNRTISYGNTFDDIVRIKSPDASILKYIAGKDIPGASGFFDASIKPLVITTLTKDIFKLRGLLQLKIAESLTKDILKLRELAVRDSKGLIVKLIAGDGRRGATGFVDTGATKKEPIQFWN